MSKRLTIVAAVALAGYVTAAVAEAGPRSGPEHDRPVDGHGFGHRGQWLLLRPIRPGAP